MNKGYCSICGYIPVRTMIVDRYDYMVSETQTLCLKCGHVIHTAIRPLKPYRDLPGVRKSDAANPKNPSTPPTSPEGAG